MGATYVMSLPFTGFALLAQLTGKKDRKKTADANADKADSDSVDAILGPGRSPQNGFRGSRNGNRLKSRSFV